jgi:hypothetical protein
MTQQQFEIAFLEYAHLTTCAPDLSCACKPATSGQIRWPGYIGPRYAEKRVLLVAARHNAGNLFTPQLRGYARILREWARTPRTAIISDTDRQLLGARSCPTEWCMRRPLS